ncbi:MAG: protein kinase, partial [Acidobacteriota bacterium]
MPRGGIDPGRWQRLRELFDAAMDVESSERPAFFASSCEGDSELRQTLESLVEHSVESGSAFDQALSEAVDFEGSIWKSLDPIGRTLGHYRIIEKIGEGGMGEVYRATDTRLNRDVAIKILPDAFTRDPERLARFEREAKVLASLSHPNIATIHGFEEADGFRFLVLELVEGVTLRTRLKEGRMLVETLVGLAAQIAEGLTKAHAAGVVHRDLKPENLMLTDDGFIKILDFGLAKATASPDAAPVRDMNTSTGRIMGTPSYMSPEQAHGDTVDHRSDLFSFGSVLYEMATGTRAFSGDTDADTLVAIMHEEPDLVEDFNAGIPWPMRAIIQRCHAKKPSDRYASTSDLASDLRDLTGRLQGISGSNPEPLARPPKRNAGRLVLASALFGLASTAIGVLWWQSGDRDGGEATRHREIIASIAVLPLENLGPPDEEYFADGMTDALITHLSKIEALKVVSSRSVMQYKGVKKPLPEIARELGVETLLTGTVLHSENRVRISSQLIKAETDRNLWAETYEGELSDILVLQGEVARAIAGAVRVRVDPEEEARIA